MIRWHANKLMIVCDGCPEMLRIRAAKPPVTVLRRNRWAINTATRHGWQHFCPSCAVEFRADEPVKEPSP